VGELGWERVGERGFMECSHFGIYGVRHVRSDALTLVTARCVPQEDGRFATIMGGQDIGEHTASSGFPYR